MDRRIGYDFRNAVHNVLNNSHVNAIITAAIIVVATYVAFVTVLQQDLVHPLTINMPTHIDSSDLTASTMSLLILLILSIIVGKAVNLLHLPFIFGALLTGVIIGNVSYFDVFHINEYWEATARRLALVILIIRWGLGFHLDIMAKIWSKVLLFGTLPGLLEAAAIATMASLVFNFSWPIGLIIGFTMAAASTPIIIPVVIDLQNDNLGTEKKIPQLIAASVGFDTLFCLTIFFTTSVCTFTTEPITTVLIRLVGEVVISALVAIVAGMILWYFPKHQEAHTVFARSALLLSLATAVINGWFFFGCGYAGIVSILVLSSVASLKWRKDNPAAIFSIERNFLYIWNMLACPLLFVLVGMKLKITEMTWPNFGTILALIAVGAVARVIGGLIFTSCSNLKPREQLVVLTAMIAKATLQGALSPSLITTAEPFPEYHSDAAFIVDACLLSALITAPLGRLILARIAPSLLRKTFVQTVQIAPVGDELPSEKKDDPFDSVTFKHFRKLQQTRAANMNGRSPPPV